MREGGRDSCLPAHLVALVLEFAVRRLQPLVEERGLCSCLPLPASRSPFAVCVVRRHTHHILGPDTCSPPDAGSSRSSPGILSGTSVDKVTPRLSLSLSPRVCVLVPVRVRVYLCTCVCVCVRARSSAVGSYLLTLSFL